MTATEGGNVVDAEVGGAVAMARVQEQPLSVDEVLAAVRLSLIHISEPTRPY